MAIAATAIGSLANNVAATNTAVLTTIAAVAAGDCIIVVAAHDNSALPSSCTDSAGNTYVRATSSGTTNAGIAISRCLNAASPLPSGGSITVTYGAALTGHMISAYKCTGAALGYAVRDFGAGVSSQSLSTLAGDLGFGGAAANTGSITNATGWTADVSTTYGSSARACYAAHRTAAGAINFNPAVGTAIEAAIAIMEVLPPTAQMLMTFR